MVSAAQTCSKAVPCACALLLAMLSSACFLDQSPPYDLTVKLAARDGGQAVEERQLNRNISSLKHYSCDVSVRLGQCVDDVPIQLVFIPGSERKSGNTECAESARSIMAGKIGQELQLGKSATGGALWIQAFRGDDEDDSGAVDTREMTALGELLQGTMTVRVVDDDHLEADLNARSVDGSSSVVGTLGASTMAYRGTLGTGPRCTWPYAAAPN